MWSGNDWRRCRCMALSWLLQRRPSAIMLGLWWGGERGGPKEGAVHTHSVDRLGTTDEIRVELFVGAFLDDLVIAGRQDHRGRLLWSRRFVVAAFGEGGLVGDFVCEWIVLYHYRWVNGIEKRHENGLV